MPVRSLKDGTITIYDGGGSSVTVDLEEGDLSFVVKQPANIISDRGVLHHARKANEVHTEASFSMMWQTLSTHAATTPYDALTKSGGAASWVSDSPTGSDYAVKLRFQAADADTTTGADDDIYFSPFYIDSIEATEGDPYGMIQVTGHGIKKTSLAAWSYLHYNLEEADPDARVDQVGNINLDTLISAPGRGTGKVGSYALAGDGATDYVYGTGANAAFDDTVNLSINAWIKRTAWEATQSYLLDIGNGAGGNGVSWLTGDGGGYTEWRTYVNTDYHRAYYLEPTNLTDDTYAMFTSVIDMSEGTAADKVKFYINGTLIAINVNDYTGTDTSLGTLGNDRVALGGLSTGTIPMISGDLIDHVTVFKGISLSAAQITTLYNSGNGLAFTSY